MKYATKWMVVPYNSSCIKSQPDNTLYDNNLPDDVKFKLYNQELLKKITKNTVSEQSKVTSEIKQDDQRIKLTANRPKTKRKLETENQVAEKLPKNSVETPQKSPVKKQIPKANKAQIKAAPKIERTKNVINNSVIEMEQDEIEDLPKKHIKENYLKNTPTIIKEYTNNPEIANLVNWETL